LQQIINGYSLFTKHIKACFDIFGDDLVSTGVVGAMCMSDWAIPLRGSHAFKRKQHRLSSSLRSSV